MFLSRDKLLLTGRLPSNNNVTFAEDAQPPSLYRRWQRIELPQLPKQASRVRFGSLWIRMQPVAQQRIQALRKDSDATVCPVYCFRVSDFLYPSVTQVQCLT